MVAERGDFIDCNENRSRCSGWRRFGCTFEADSFAAFCVYNAPKFFPRACANSPVKSRTIDMLSGTRSRRVAVLVAATACAAIVVWTGWNWWIDRRELALAKDELARNDFAAAGIRLERLAARSPNDSEIGYLRGVQAFGAGDIDTAADAWRGVAADSAFAVDAASRCAELERGRGRYAEAESVLSRVLSVHPIDESAQPLVRGWGDLLRLEGRFDELKTWIEDVWDAAGRPLVLIKSHALLDLEPTPLEWLEAELEVASRRAPDDDRVRLAQANVAILAGRLAEAKALLESCVKRRGDDRAVRRSILNLAIARDDAAAANRAMLRLPATLFSPATIKRYRSWLAAKTNDRDAERIALEEQLAVDPANTIALERLAAIEVRANRVDRVRRRRAEKSKIDQTIKTYYVLIKTLTDNDVKRRAGEAAALAAALHRDFEARAWRSIAGDEVAGTRGRVRFDAAALGIERSEAGVAQGEQGGEGTLGALVSDLAPRAIAANRTTDRGGANEAPRVPRFEDVALKSGLIFTYENGASALRQLPETMSGGAALLDYDGDGSLDVYLVQGGAFPPAARRGATRNRDRLFRNRGDGTFEDVSKQSHISEFFGGYGHAATAGDYDGDGDADLFVTRYDSYALYRNEGDGTFVDVTAAAGLDGERAWPTSAAWADFDGDGDLDLYVCHYVKWNADNPRTCRHIDNSYVYCDPKLFEAAPDRIFRNDGGKFMDMTRESGIVDEEGRGLGVIAADLDGDGAIDVFTANDGSANFFFRNLGNFRFEERAATAGLAASSAGGYQAGMGIARGDFDGDGAIDLFVANFYGESTTFFRNLSGGLYADQSAAIGLQALTRGVLGFGIVAADFNDDGRIDLAQANGHVNDYHPLFPYKMPMKLFLNQKSGRLVDASATAGDCFAVPRLGRGLAVGDLDGDFALDLIVVDQNGPVGLLNARTKLGRSIELKLEGTKSNRDAIGAVVKITYQDQSQTLDRFGGGSYQSTSTPFLHVGLGDAPRVDSIEIRWPSGLVETIGPLAVDRRYRVCEGSGKAEPIERRNPKK